MYFDALLRADTLQEASEAVRAAEQTGFDAVWTNETAHDPFLPLAVGATLTSRIRLGTAVATAFPRSPTVMAHTAWDIARASEGRFILGLGTQVKAHIERRFGVAWDSPVERLRDYIAAMRAVWQTWQTGERLRHEGPYYSLKLMTPFFSPPPLPEPTHIPPIFIAGVNMRLCRLAGEVCDGFHVHPFHTSLYLEERVIPWIEEGLAVSGRNRSAFQVCASIFAIAGKGEQRQEAREQVRRGIAFYASTPSYRILLEAHGWTETGAELSRLAAQGRWDEMGNLISDEMLSEIAVEGDTLADIAREIKTRYAGLADRVALYTPFVPGERNTEWSEAVAEMRKSEPTQYTRHSDMGK